MAEQGSTFDFVYLAFHGSRAGLWLSEAEEEALSLDQLARLMGRAGEGAVIHFGSCSVLNQPASKLSAFLKETRARAICGYTKSVDWVDCAAFDLALLYNLATYQRAGDALNRMQSPAYAGLADELGFSRFPQPRAD